MQNKIHNILTIGIDNQKGFLVSIETITKRGLFQFEIIGLANKTISESKQRILSAIDYSTPEKKTYLHKKIVTLLSPAGIKKEGSHFDLPIAISYIISGKEYLQSFFDEVIILGELTLTGSILCVKNINTLIEEGIKKGIKHFIIPQDSSVEFIKEDIYTWKVANISEIIDIIENKKRFNQKGQRNFLFKKSTLSEHPRCLTETSKEKTGLTYLIDSIVGNENLKRALQISLAGKHNLLLIGEPGSGKSLIAKSSRELLPLVKIINLNNIQIEKLIESREQRLTGEIENTFKAPFREPHHTSSYSEIIGNRNIPGEIVLSNRGILFLDEMSEINKRVIEGLRQPLEDKYIQINQGEKIETDFILIGSMNPCDCGFYKSKNRRCICTRTQIDRFQRKISSPLFQRFDLNINIATFGSCTYNNKSNPKGEYIFQNIVKVREIQNNRKYSYIKRTNEESINTDNLLHSRHLLLALDSLNEKSLGTKEKNLLIDITKRFYFSKREVSSLLRVARTIADIENEKQIKEVHIHEALLYKNKRE